MINCKINLSLHITTMYAIFNHFRMEPPPSTHSDHDVSPWSPSILFCQPSFFPPDESRLINESAHLAINHLHLSVFWSFFFVSTRPFSCFNREEREGDSVILCSFSVQKTFFLCGFPPLNVWSTCELETHFNNVGLGFFHLGAETASVRFFFVWFSRLTTIMTFQGCNVTWMTPSWGIDRDMKLSVDGLGYSFERPLVGLYIFHKPEIKKIKL